MTGPLAGRRVLVTRPAHQAGGLAQAIRDAGGEPLLFPALGIEALPATQFAADRAWLKHADALIFISPNAVRYGLTALGPLPADAQIFAVGPGTASGLREAGLAGVLTPDGQDSEALLAMPALAAVAGRRIALVRGVGGRPLLGDTLVARGAAVRVIECYRRVRPQADSAPLLARWQAGGLDAVTVASAETLANLIAILGESSVGLLARTPVFVPHEKIAASASHMGLTHVHATPGGDAGLVEGMIRWFNDAENR